MTLADSSPCDCSVIPVRPKNAERIYPNRDDPFADALDEAEEADEDLAVCPSCLKSFPIDDCSPR